MTRSIYIGGLAWLLCAIISMATGLSAPTVAAATGTSGIMFCIGFATDAILAAIKEKRPWK